MKTTVFYRTKLMQIRQKRLKVKYNHMPVVSLWFYFVAPSQKGNLNPSHHTQSTVSPQATAKTNIQALYPFPLFTLAPSSPQMFELIQHKQLIHSDHFIPSLPLSAGLQTKETELCWMRRDRSTEIRRLFSQPGGRQGAALLLH